MSTKPASPALPPVLAPAAARKPVPPAGLTALCFGAWTLGALGLAVVAWELFGLAATAAGPLISPPATLISPLVKLDHAERAELHLIRSHFFSFNFLSALGLLAKSAALLIGGFAAFGRSEWGRQTLSWTARLGVLFLAYTAILGTLQTSYEAPIKAQFSERKRDAVAQNSSLKAPSPISSTPLLAMTYLWTGLVVVFSAAQGIAFFFAWRYLESEEVLEFFREQEWAREVEAEVV